MKIVKTHTGKIYVDIDNRLEFLTVGDYGKENNIKADFLGLTKEINGVANTEVNLEYSGLQRLALNMVVKNFVSFVMCLNVGIMEMFLGKI